MNSTICYSMKHIDGQNSRSRRKKTHCTLTILMKKEESTARAIVTAFTAYNSNSNSSNTKIIWARIDNWEKGWMWSTNITLKLPHIVKITLHKFYNLFYCWKHWRPYDDTHTRTHSLYYPYLCGSLCLPLTVCFMRFAVWFRYSSAIAYSHAPKHWMHIII